MMAGALLRGTVTRASASGVWCRIPKLVPNHEYGPLTLVANLVRVGPTTDSRGDTTAEASWYADLVAPGDTVLVANLGSTSLPDLVVVGALRKGVTP